MGRRSVRKLPAGLDLSGWLRNLEELPRPLDPVALFGRRAPLEVELGSGKGLFLATAATQHPERDFLGVELAAKYAQHAAARLAKGRRTNARVVHGDGLRLFREWLPDNAVEAVHVYFPDPWWKARHKKRRIMTAGLSADVVRTLHPSGRLHFWTDVEEYFQTTLALVAGATPLVGPLSVDEAPALHELDYRTHFERRMRLHSLPVYRAEFRKAGTE